MIAYLEGNILRGISVGRTEVQVISPVTGRVIGSSEIKVQRSKETVTDINVKLVTGIMYRLNEYIIKVFQVWFRYRLISASLDPVLSLDEKSCIASYFRQFSTNIKKYEINALSFRVQQNWS